MLSRLYCGAGLALLCGLLVGPAPAAAQGGGTIKGQIVWDGPMPKRAEINVNQDKAHCLSKGKLYSDKIIVNPKNKGVKWVVVYLVDATDAKKKLPVPAALQKVSGKVELDQPCCMFEPHIAVVRVGQSLVLKNSSPVAHNTNVQSGAPGTGPNLNPIIPPGKSVEVEANKFVPRFLPIPVSCSIHNWMKCHVCVFDHPFYAVTDKDGKFEIKNVPLGKYRLIGWQEEVGWADGKSPLKGGGKMINVVAQTNVGKIKIKQTDD
jgi:hypothetical protein